mmetsp:Transcript_25362/g.80244  ORF Transcript_25362/g.80244 Transcript_25362/m.80244 type:complete len:427 (+) Transcript_25362:2029-3309(+)
MQRLDRILRHDLVVHLRVGHGELALLLRELLAPRGEVKLDVLLLHHVVEDAHAREDVRGNGHVCLLVLVELSGVDVDVADRRARGEALELAGDAVVKAHPKGEEQIGLVDRVVGVHRAVHAEHAERRRPECLLVARHRPQAHEGRGHRNAVCAGKLGDFLSSAVGATANVEHGALRLGDLVDDWAELGGGGRRRQAGDVAGKGHGELPVGHVHLLLDVLGDVNQHRAWAARGGEVERLVDHARDVVHVKHQVVVLGDLPRDLHDGGLLERVRTDHAAGHLPGDGHHGHRVEHGVSEASDQVCGARAGGGNAHTHPAGTLGVALGGKHLALLVAAEDVGDGFGAGESLVDLHGRAARVGEEHVNALPLKGLHENVTTLALLLIREAGDKVGGGLVLPDGAGPCGLPGDVQLLLGCSLAQVVRERGLN